MKRPSRILLIAVALSLLVHLVVALGLRPAEPGPPNQAEVVSIVQRSATIAVTRRPTPPPPPRPRETPHARSAAPPRKSTPRGENAAPSQGSSVGRAPVTPAPEPSPPAPVAVATSCARRTIPAAVVATPMPPEIAPDARASATSGTTIVKVKLDAAAAILDTSVAQSSGSSSLDLVAVGMAREARFSPVLADCKPVAGEYAFSVKFVAW
jgi:TonB family protein